MPNISNLAKSGDHLTPRTHHEFISRIHSEEKIDDVGSPKG